LLKRGLDVIASPAPASPGEAGGAKRRSNLFFFTVIDYPSSCRSYPWQ
jgi:hypothetical protein